MLIGFDTNDLTDQMYYDWWQDGNQVLLRSAKQALRERQLKVFKSRSRRSYGDHEVAGCA